MTLSTLFSLAFALLCTGVLACGESLSPTLGSSPDVTEGRLQTEPVLPILENGSVDRARIHLGRKLFGSPVLSGDGQVRCSDCHFADHGLADRAAKSIAPGRPATDFNSPSLFNLGYVYRYTWSARFESLEDHIDALITNPKVMGTTWQDIGTRLNEDSGWIAAFREIYGQPPNGPRARDALLAYERSLATPHAPFDAWLRGDDTAINELAKQGYALFKRYGCINCHQGAAVGGNMMARLGVVRDYFTELSLDDKISLGRFAHTKRAEDLHVFRVPSLRNVALTAPYFHDGSAATLPQAVTIMARYQLGRDLTDSDTTAIEAFLESLTGRVPDD